MKQVTSLAVAWIVAGIVSIQSDWTVFESFVVILISSIFLTVSDGAGNEKQ